MNRKRPADTEKLLAELHTLRERVASLEEQLEMDGETIPPNPFAGSSTADNLHYLEAELYRLLQTDPSIFRFLENGSLDGMWYWDLDNPEHEWMSPRFWELFGYKPAEKEHLASEWQDMIFKDDLATALDNFHQHCADPAHPYDQLVRYRHRDGSTVWVRCRGLAIRNADGRPVRMLGAHNDITYLKLIEEELRTSRRMYRQLVENAGSIIMHTDTEGYVTFINSYAERMLNIPHSAIIDRPLAETPFSGQGPGDTDLGRIIHQQIAESEQAGACEGKIKSADGRIHWLHWNNQILADDRGNCTGVLSVGTDITARKQAQFTLQRVRATLDSTAESVFWIDRQGRFFDVNEPACRTLGYTRTELLGKFLADITPGDIAADWDAHWVRIQEKGHDIFETVHRTREGHIFPVEVAAHWQAFGGDSFICIFVRDISERKRTEAQLRRAEERLRVAQDAAQIGIFEHDFTTGAYYFSDIALRALGVDAVEDITDSLLLDAVEPTCRSRIREEVLALRTQEGDFSLLLPIAAGADARPKRWVEVKGRTECTENGAPIRSLGAVRDVTAAQEHLQRLTESEQRHKAFFEKNGAVMLLIEADTGSLLDANPAACAFYGYERFTLQHMTIYDLNTLSTDAVREHKSRASEGKRNLFQFTHRLSDGSIRDVEVRTSPFYLNDRVVLHSIITDITDQLQQEKRLRTLMHAVETLPTSVVITDTAGRIEYANPFFAKQVGYDWEDIISNRPTIHSFGRQAQNMPIDLSAIIKSRLTWRGELKTHGGHGETIWQLAVISPVTDETGQVIKVVAIMEDITERKKLETIKEDVDRIIRHDLKTPLHGIINLPELLSDPDAIAPEDRELLEVVRNAGRKMLRLVNSSLFLHKLESGQYTLKLEPLELVRHLKDIQSELSFEAGRRDIHFDLYVNGAPLKPDQQVFLESDATLTPFMFSNLIKNAVEGAPQGATVTISLYSGDPFRITIHNPGAVPEPVRQQFFTKYATHGKQSGTGLGTYSAKLIAEAHGGIISLQTSERDGTAVSISLPQHP